MASNQLIFAGLKPFLSHTEKLFIVSFYRQFSTNINQIKIITSFVSMGFWLLGASKNNSYLNFFYFNNRGNLFVIRCDK